MSNQITADEVIKELGLVPLTIEGGYFAETYRSEEMVPFRRRCAGTCIYYLLRAHEVSKWHKVASDEIWLYHTGVSAKQLLLFPNGRIEERLIGGNLTAGERPQSLIPAGCWQTAVLTDREQGAWGLFGATVVPGFEYEDFTEATCDELKALVDDQDAFDVRMKEFYKGSLPQ